MIYIPKWLRVVAILALALLTSYMTGYYVANSKAKAKAAELVKANELQQAEDLINFSYNMKVINDNAINQKKADDSFINAVRDDNSRMLNEINKLKAKKQSGVSSNTSSGVDSEILTILGETFQREGEVIEDFKRTESIATEMQQAIKVLAE